MVHWLKRAALAVGGCVLSACSPLTALDMLVPSDSYTAATDIAYGPGARHKLDVYRPKVGEGPFPVVVFFYGGSWRWGKRQEYRFVGEALARRGVVAVVPDYRVFPEVRFPGFVEDGAAAFAWVKRNIAAHGGDASRVFLSGHSAGAHTAALLALDGGYLSAEGLSTAAVCGVVGLAGPYYFDPSKFDSVKEIFEHLPDTNTSRPIAFAGPHAPPMLLIHGAEDTTVFPLNTERMTEALREAGVAVETELLPGIGHYRIIAAVAKPFEGIAPVADPLARYVREKGRCG